MAYEQKDNSGLLGLNDRKEKDSHPDHKGSALIGGVEYWISGWNKENQYGPFISLAFQRKDAAPNFQKGTVPVGKPKVVLPIQGDFDADVPF